MVDLPPTFDADFHDKDSVVRMEYLKLGRTDLQVSKISLGSGQFTQFYGSVDIPFGCLTSVFSSF